MLCVEWWSFVVGIFLMGEYVSSLDERRKNRDYSMERVHERFLIYKLQTIKKKNERVSAVNEGVSMYFISVSMYLSSYIDNENVIQY